MQVTELTVHTLSVPEGERDRADTTSDMCVVEVETDDGPTGIGEAESSPEVTAAIVHAPRSHSLVTGLADVVVGNDPFDVEAIWEEMFERTYYYGRKGAVLAAMSAVDMALWDIVGKATDQPVHRLLGGRHRDSVRAYMSTLFPQDPTDTEHMRSEARAAMEAGYTAIKFGWGGFGQDREHDLALVGAARDELGEGFDIMLDAGMAFDGDVKRAVKGVREIDDAHDVFWIEEPFRADDFEGYRTLAERCDTRVVGGEEEYTVYGFRNLVDYGGVDGVQPDVARCGGITQMQKVATLADAEGLPLYVHGWSSEILTAANLQVIAANRNMPLIEHSRRASPLRFGVVEEEFPLENGHIAVPDRPGLGITLDRDTLEQYG